MNRIAFTMSLVAGLVSPVLSRAEEKRFDVVVYGGTSAGVAAAVQCRTMGKTVVIIEPSDHVGGLTTNGLGYTDTGDKRVIGGLSRAFYQAIKQHYDQQSAWIHEKSADYARYRPDDDAMWTFEPHVAEAIYERWIAEHGVAIDRGRRLNRKKAPVRNGLRIVSIETENGTVYRGRMFIDATYEGDLMAAAGVTYTVGRESNSKYGETLNGVQKARNTHNHRFVRKVDPYRKPGDPKSGLLPGVSAEPPGTDGAADRRLQAFCYRMCMTDVRDNQAPFLKPAGYEPLRYELLFRNFGAGDLRLPLAPGRLPNGKTDTNNNGAFSTDNIGLNYDYAEASYAEREAMLREHLRYQKGLMWTLGHHPRTPKSIREQMAKWGLAKDEFHENDHWPRQIYVRESRRMVSDYVVTELDCRRERVAKDSVGLGSYNMDSHNVQRYVTPDGFVQNEGDVQESPGGAYLVSYRSIVPRRGETTNLLVPVCLSASHIAFGSIRMEPVYMILGQSAATAAVLAIENDAAVQDVPYPALRERLLRDKQVLDLPAGSRPKRLITLAQLKGVVIDDTQAELLGGWSASSSTAPYVESGYRHNGNLASEDTRAVFRTKLNAGRYDVRLSYSAFANRSSKTRVTVRHRDGVATVAVNQRKKGAVDGLFQSLGQYAFDAKNAAEVVVHTADADGYVIVDAVQFLPVQ